jgi:hypothetical protein
VRKSPSTELVPPVRVFSDLALRELRDVLGTCEDTDERRLRAVLTRLCDEARAANAPAERLVDVLKEARDMPEADPSIHALRRSRYGSSLVMLLALHFEEEAP